MFKNCTTLLGIEADCGTVSIIWTSGMRSNSHEARKDPAWLEGSLSLLFTFEGIYTLFTLSLLSAIWRPLSAFRALCAELVFSYSKKQ